MVEIGRIASLANVVPDHLDKAPATVLIDSVYVNDVKGTYTLQCDHYLYFPVYYCKETKLFLWHDLWQQYWVGSKQIGGKGYMWRVRSRAKSLSPTKQDLVKHGVEGTFTISKITVSKPSVLHKLKEKFSPKSTDELKEAVRVCIA